ncbi:hypothetical protein L1887_22956 [Cichorium endivia]|nr:hypothetical protein L1887_22956 [Cichorium endivia]
MVPDIAFGQHFRVALDVGCGVASFGAFLLDRNVTTLSIAPKDVHENQIQFSLERGVPAMVNRMLRVGGYFVWAAQPVYKHEDKLQEQWKALGDTKTVIRDENEVINSNSDLFLDKIYDWMKVRNRNGSTIGVVDHVERRGMVLPFRPFSLSFNPVNHSIDMPAARILALNASYFLKTRGYFVISIKENCIDSTVPAEAVFASEVKKLQAEQFKPMEQVTLEPFERDHACVVGAYRVPKKQKPSS